MDSSTVGRWSHDGVEVGEFEEMKTMVSTLLSWQKQKEDQAQRKRSTKQVDQKLDTAISELVQLATTVTRRPRPSTHSAAPLPQWDIDDNTRKLTRKVLVLIKQLLALPASAEGLDRIDATEAQTEDLVAHVEKLATLMEIEAVHSVENENVEDDEEAKEVKEEPLTIDDLIPDDYDKDYDGDGKLKLPHIRLTVLMLYIAELAEAAKDFDWNAPDLETAVKMEADEEDRKVADDPAEEILEPLQWPYLEKLMEACREAQVGSAEVVSDSDCFGGSDEEYQDTRSTIPGPNDDNEDEDGISADVVTEEEATEDEDVEEAAEDEDMEEVAEEEGEVADDKDSEDGDGDKAAQDQLMRVIDAQGFQDAPPQDSENDSGQA